MARARKIQTFRLFFPAAAFLAAITVPLSVWAVQSGTGWPPGLLGAGHGHELLFGFALALIAGYTLGPQPPVIVLSLGGLWLATRIAWLLSPDSWTAMILDPLFALTLAWLAVPRFSAAKKWRNRMVGPLILVTCLIPLVWQASPWLSQLFGEQLPDQRQLMHFAILCLLLLMTFMGGRIIAPAAAGTLEKKGIPLEARVQPRIEAALIILLAAAAVFILIPGLAPASGMTLLVASLLILIRTLRWQLWLCPERPDLIALGIGYLWLSVGAGTTGLTLLAGDPPAASLHLITTGGLGSLSSAVTLRLYFQRARRKPPPRLWVWAMVSLVSLSAIARFMAGTQPFSEPGLLWLSASCWGLAFLALGVRLAMPMKLTAS
ncbi:NnrS family protein [Marinobacter sp.]|uniref:NnrS family protein n=1 Tax=Marinobacter sp. TaxID=50741 RepID=UPI00384C61D2